jgi:glycosyltransferase involved in cell wall biosynthesis
METSNRLKILNVLGGSREGGAEKFFERISLSLSKEKNVDLELIIRKNSNRYKRLNSEIKKIHQINFFYFFNPFCHNKINEIYEKFKPDIVLSWMNRASRLLPNSRKYNCINIGRMGGYYKIKNYVNCDYIITNTIDLRNFVINKGWDSEKVEFIPNFVNENTNKKLEIKSDKKILLCLGRFHKNKGIDILLKAMTYISEFKLWIVGSGEEKQLYDEIVSRYNIKSKVDFFEWTDDISQFLNSANILICPSRHEPFGNVIVEAWAHRVPVIVSDTGGPKLLVKNAVNGLKFEKEDMFDLLKQIKLVESNSKLRKKIISNGYNEFKKRFSEDLIIKKYLNFFYKVSK